MHVTRCSLEPLKWTALIRDRYFSHLFPKETLKESTNQYYHWFSKFVPSTPSFHFVSMHRKCHGTTGARKFFDEMPLRNVATYNAMIGGYCMNGDMELASILFDRMSFMDHCDLGIDD